MNTHTELSNQFIKNQTNKLNTQRQYYRIDNQNKKKVV